MHHDHESRAESQFYKIIVVRSQYFPQCVKYLFRVLSFYLLHSKNISSDGYILKQSKTLVKEGFVCLEDEYIKFSLDSPCTPFDLEMFVNYHPLKGVRCGDDKHLLLILLKDRFFKGDMTRLRILLKLKDYSRILNFVENCIWERGYEDNYTLGQQISIRMTTNLIQSGLDFKHQINKAVTVHERGWNDKVFIKMISSIKTVADITKRYKSNTVYVMLELDEANLEYALGLLHDNFSSVLTNQYVKNLCLICDCKNSVPVLMRLRNLITARLVNVVFVTDSENYNENRIFYVYNSMKFYYYCLKNLYVFMYNDYETLYLIFTIVCLEILNGGCLNSFTLEKSLLMNPLELNSRRVNALKRAAVNKKVLCNDMELKIDFIKGKRIKTGSNYESRLVSIK
ncbi:p47 [Spodoptera litura granulovirus]|uniref:P47 n=1 Tax=Spodoptera litura granulovirus TaxID=359919 RepID=A5IZR0_9BBAC|nr:p47 [Spodoptera litura granulovirus]ABQ52001.1 p47 [Spodoptera litura granulovirus]